MNREKAGPAAVPDDRDNRGGTDPDQASARALRGPELRVVLDLDGPPFRLPAPRWRTRKGGPVETEQRADSHNAPIGPLWHGGRKGSHSRRIGSPPGRGSDSPATQPECWPNCPTGLANRTGQPDRPAGPANQPGNPSWQDRLAGRAGIPPGGSVRDRRSSCAVDRADRSLGRAWRSGTIRGATAEWRAVGHARIGP